jgi:hypothetical protein
MRSPGAHQHGGIVSREIGPLLWKPSELPGIILKEHAILAPRLTGLDQLEGPATQGVEGMGNSESLRRTARQRCN